MNEAVATLVNIIINLNDQLRLALMELEKLRATVATATQGIPPPVVEEKETP